MSFLSQRDSAKTGPFHLERDCFFVFARRLNLPQLELVFSKRLTLNKHVLEMIKDFFYLLLQWNLAT